MGDIVEKIEGMTAGGSPFLLIKEHIVLPLHEIQAAINDGQIQDEETLIRFCEDWWNNNQKTISKPIEWLEHVDQKTLARAEPFLRLVFEGRSVNKEILSHFEKLEANITEAQVEFGNDWEKVFTFVKQKIGNMNQLLPLSEISQIALEEMPVLPLALADNMEERDNVSGDQDFFRILEEKIHTLDKEYTNRFSKL